MTSFRPSWAGWGPLLGSLRVVHAPGLDQAAAASPPSLRRARRRGCGLDQISWTPREDECDAEHGPKKDERRDAAGLAEARAHLAREFELSQAEQDELLPSGRQSRFANRVAWAKVHLESAGLLTTPQRGHFIISDRGRDVLKAPPARIDIKFLGQYPEFLEFRKPKRGARGDSAPTTENADAETPEEALEASSV